MTNFSIDEQRIFEAIMSVDAPPMAKEQGAELVDAWIRTFGPADMQLEITAVELGFIVYVDALTAVIGVQDMIARDAVGYFGNEWKSAKEPKRYNGKDSWWWNGDVWLQDIASGAQIRIYALALNQGTFYEKDSKRVIEFSQSNPRIRVRAAVKSSPPRFWPEDDPGVYEFNADALASIADGLRAKAEQIRCVRRGGIVPWQLTGKQCHQFGNECPYYAKFCTTAKHPVGLEGNEKLTVQFDMSDPAAEAALPFIPEKLLANPDFVVLSASQYTLASDCAEKYRIVNSGLAPKYATDEQATGTVMHAGLAEFYRQLRDRH